MLLFRQLSHQETRLLSLQHDRCVKTIDLTARNGYLSMRTITGDRLQLVLQPHAVWLSGFRNPRAPLSSFAARSMWGVSMTLLRLSSGWLLSTIQN